MEVIPAIDLRQGQVVRLYQGDYERQTSYSTDPVAVAQEWEGQGAQRLHVVDLDGAKSGGQENLEIVRRIASAIGIPIQLGGGLRSLDAVERALEAGATRAVLGTAAINDPALVEQVVRNSGADAVVVGVDARDGFVAVHGWTEGTELTASSLIGQMQALGVFRFLYTDIARDGTLTEPNFDAITDLLEGTGATLLASGGVASVDHIRKLAAIGVEGAILGRALYEGTIDLTEALSTQTPA